MRAIKKIIIHTSATRAVQDIGAKEIDQWHKAQGWQAIGYHWVVRRNGKREKGRSEDKIGSHAKGHNHDSIGICWVGGVSSDRLAPEDNRTQAQRDELKKLVLEVRGRYPGAKVLGHNELPGVNKDCPCIDMDVFRKELGL